MNKNNKNKKKLSGITLLFTIALSALGLNSIEKKETISDLAMANIDALARDEGGSVTCNSDKGDTCVVGGTSVADYDEGCASWFWG